MTHVEKGQGGPTPAPNGDLRHALIPILPRLRRFCLALAGNRDSGDDLAQAAIARALAAEGRFEPGTRLDSWLFKIAQNLHIDERRKQATRGSEVDPEILEDRIGSDGRDIVEQRSDLAYVRERFAALPEEQRGVLTLIVIEGRSYKEAAEILEIPVGTVMSRLCRARAALGRAIGGDSQ